jgi:hypothetical protein
MMRCSAFHSLQTASKEYILFGSSFLYILPRESDEFCLAKVAGPILRQGPESHAWQFDVTIGNLKLKNRTSPIMAGLHSSNREGS